MILVCPSCQARYLVSADIFTAGARRVRCARCQHAWEEQRPTDLDALAAMVADIPPPPQQVDPIPEGSALPTFRRVSLTVPPWLRHMALVGLAGLGVILLMVALLDRTNIAKRWPSTERIYNALWIPIPHAGDELEISDVKPEVRYEDGVAMLEIEGNIKNPLRHEQNIPPLQATAIGSNGEAVYSWTIEPPAPTLGGKETMSFKSAIKSPKGTVIQIHLNFIEPPNASD